MASEADAAAGDDVFVSASASDGHNPAQDAVIHAWLDIQGLTARAAKGRLVRLVTGIDRQAVIENSALLEPVISFYGHSAENDG